MPTALSPPLSPPIPWREVARRTVRAVADDNCPGLAAQLSFYFLLSLFPALLFFVALVAYMPLETVLTDLLAALQTVAPAELLDLVRGQADQIAAGGQAGVLTLGVIGAIWGSSAAMVAVIDALNRAYDVAEWRPWWKRRLVAIALTVTLAAFVALALMLLSIGPSVAFRLAEWLSLGSAVAWTWSLLRWPVMVSCLLFAMDLVYHVAPNRRTPWTWLTPGALLATALWIGSSYGFRFYITNLNDVAATYGAIGGAIVTMLWFYMSSFAILIGAELNAVIEHAWREPRHT